jgi:hypothetical protein
LGLLTRISSNPTNSGPQSAAAALPSLAVTDSPQRLFDSLAWIALFFEGTLSFRCGAS